MLKEKNSSKAFTLTECSIFLLTVGLVGALATTYTMQLRRHALYIQADTLIATTRHLQQYAMASGQPCSLTISSSCNAYTWSCGSKTRTHKLPHMISIGNDAKPHLGPPSSVHPTPVEPVTFPHKTIYIAPSGILSAGSIYLSSGTTLCALTSNVGSRGVMRCYVATSKDTWNIRK